MGQHKEPDYEPCCLANHLADVDVNAISGQVDDDQSTQPLQSHTWPYDLPHSYDLDEHQCLMYAIFEIHVSDSIEYEPTKQVTFSYFFESGVFWGCIDRGPEKIEKYL